MEGPTAVLVLSHIALSIFHLPVTKKIKIWAEYMLSILLNAF